MSKAEVERLLIAGGSEKNLRVRYDATEEMSAFVALAVSEGYDFTAEELQQVLTASGDSFESMGNPRRREIWWS